VQPQPLLNHYLVLYYLPEIVVAKFCDIFKPSRIYILALAFYSNLGQLEIIETYIL